MKKVVKGVYCLTSPSGKRYVGVGIGKKGVFGRWVVYKNLRKNLKLQPILYNALAKHGPENFKYDIVLETSDPERAYKVEETFIALWNLTNSKYGYNQQRGRPTTKDIYEKNYRRLLAGQVGRPPRVAHKHTPETIAKLKRMKAEEAGRMTREDRMRITVALRAGAALRHANCTYEDYLSAYRKTRATLLSKMTAEEYSKFNAENGRRCSAAILANSTPQQRSERAKKASEFARLALIKKQAERVVPQTRDADIRRWLLEGALQPAKPRKKVSEETRQKMREASKRRWAVKTIAKSVEVSCAATNS